MISSVSLVHCTIHLHAMKLIHMCMPCTVQAPHGVLAQTPNSRHSAGTQQQGNSGNPTGPPPVARPLFGQVASLPSRKPSTGTDFGADFGAVWAHLTSLPVPVQHKVLGCSLSGMASGECAYEASSAGGMNGVDPMWE